MMSRPVLTASDMAPAAVDVETHDDGTSILRCPHPLGDYPTAVTDKLLEWAERTPGATFIAERRDGEWYRVTYREAADAIAAIGQSLIDRGLGPELPVMILSGNSVSAALLMLGAMHVGVPVAPVSVAYSLQCTDHTKLRGLGSRLAPGLVYAEQLAPFEGAIAGAKLGAAPLADRQVVEAMAATTVTAAVASRHAAIDGDTVAKYLFTSGSTGLPKGVLNTHRMLCSNQRAIEVLWPFLGKRPPVLVDWLPWSHTFGSNHNLHMVLWHGGALYIDAGKPAPGLFDASAANLLEISPTLYFNVPRGFDMLVGHLEQDDALRAKFFGELDVIFYAAAALPPHLWAKLEAMSLEERGAKVMMLSAWGSTETAPLATSVHYPIERAGVIGLPAPGTELKMVPNEGKLELRVRGPNVTPGYLKDDDLTAAAFDDEGYFLMGDAGKLADPEDPAAGIVFDGRIAESFTLTSGTWVHVGDLRTTLIAAAAPVIGDCVLTGHDRDFIGLIVFPNLDACRRLACDDELDLAGVSRHPAVIDALRAGIAEHNRANPASSRSVRRVIISREPPSIDAGEITDKGYINQRAVLERRAELVAALHYGGEVIDIS